MGSKGSILTYNYIFGQTHDYLNHNHRITTGKKIITIDSKTLYNKKLGGTSL